uniref:Putative secreted protein n=1 Tax=Anopheles triannulatus TaxID=58253 RepID=A0A2M4B6D7_9DIPT
MKTILLLMRVSAGLRICEGLGRLWGQPPLRWEISDSMMMMMTPDFDLIPICTSYPTGCCDFGAIGAQRCREKAE